MSENISVVIIAKNEEKDIPRCLNSLKNFADEIIVVDDESTDNTAKIALEYGAKVFRRPLNNNFAEQTNFGINKAKNNWIFIIDADEELTEDLKKEIIERIGKEEYSAYQMPIKNIFYGKFLEYGGVKGYKIRLFKKSNAYFIGEVHQNLIVNGKIGTLKNYFIHHLKSVDDYLFKILKYTDIEAKNFVNSQNKIKLKEVKYRLTYKTFKTFFKLYIKKKGYKDGHQGLIWAILNTIGPQIRWLKIYDKAFKEDKLEF